ncbi:MAG: Uma2 family endonuclease [Pseudomonadota bacterium]|nr:Uma2 family endonuclease [Pseudomonadota bacterium]
MSLDEFMAWEERQEPRYEFDGLDIEERTGGTITHAQIQVNLIAALNSRLRRGPYRVVGSILKVKTKTSIRYPDAMVMCSPARGSATATSEPVVLFEILSPSTARKDLGAKNAEYQTLRSLRRYIVLHQNVAAAEVFFRDENGEWAHEFVGRDGALNLPEIGATMALAECYEEIDLSAAQQP